MEKRLSQQQLGELFSKIEAEVQQPGGIIAEAQLLILLKSHNPQPHQSLWVANGFQESEIVRAFAAYRAKRDYVSRINR